MGRKLPTINDGLQTRQLSHLKTHKTSLHVMVVSLDGEREATVNLRTVRHIGTSQGAARQHSLLLLIEADSAELLPVADQLVFDNDFVDGELSLSQLSVVMAP
jgi:hypothetical protein